MSKKVLYTTSTHYLMETWVGREKTYFVVETNNALEYDLMSTNLDEAMDYLMSRKAN